MRVVKEEWIAIDDGRRRAVPRCDERGAEIAEMRRRVYAALTETPERIETVAGIAGVTPRWASRVMKRLIDVGAVGETLMPVRGKLARRPYGYFRRARMRGVVLEWWTCLCGCRNLICRLFCSGCGREAGARFLATAVPRAWDAAGVADGVADEHQEEQGCEVADGDDDEVAHGANACW